jgi:predicted RNA binding protein YcfA (HicA-like mRNA interferase family)
MSRPLSTCTGKDVLWALERAGFYIHHFKGSHHSLRHPTKPRLRVVVPAHAKDLPQGTLRAILKHAEHTEDAFLDLL